MKSSLCFSSHSLQPSLPRLPRPDGLTLALSIHGVTCCKGDRKSGGSQEGESPDPEAEASDLGGLRKLLQLQPVPVATRPVRAGVPSLVHSLRRALDRPVPSRLSGADLTHVLCPHVAVGSSRRRSRRPLRARHSLKDGLPEPELLSATTGMVQREQSIPAARQNDRKGQGSPGTLPSALPAPCYGGREGLESTGVGMEGLHK